MRMTPLGPHADFIVTAYAATIVIVIGLTAWVWSDYRAQRRALAELERRGVKRRSRPKRQ
jgi:heme exporter protein D